MTNHLQEFLQANPKKATTEFGVVDLRSLCLNPISIIVEFWAKKTRRLCPCSLVDVS